MASWSRCLEYRAHTTGTGEHVHALKRRYTLYQDDIWSPFPRKRDRNPLPFRVPIVLSMFFLFLNLVYPALRLSTRAFFFKVADLVYAAGDSARNKKKSALSFRKSHARRVVFEVNLPTTPHIVSKHMSVRAQLKMQRCDPRAPHLADMSRNQAHQGRNTKTRSAVRHMRETYVGSFGVFFLLLGRTDRIIFLM